MNGLCKKCRPIRCRDIPIKRYFLPSGSLVRRLRVKLSVEGPPDAVAKMVFNYVKKEGLSKFKF